MFFIVTLSLRTVSVTQRAAGRRSLTQTQSATQQGPTALQHKFSDALVYSLLRGLSKPIPDHITFPPRTDILPARILLFYFDDEQVRAVLKIKSVDDEFCIDGQYRRIIADMTSTSETELRAFVQAAGVVKTGGKLRKEDLMAALLLGDYRKAAAERTKIHALHTRLEQKAEKLKEEAGELKFLEFKLADANAKVERLSSPKVNKKQGRDSMGQAGVEAHKHRYPTRYSLTSSIVAQEENA